MQRVEVYNWGTFDEKVWSFDLTGRNALLTGDIGSGKSTLVDAISTLLLRSDRIAYNKAAGAGTAERTLRSYVLGHYKAERSEETGQTRPIGLRSTRDFSVLLGVFANEGYGDVVSLAQVFRMKNAQDTQPERFYVVADRELSIAKDFADFGDDFAPLRRRLRQSGARVWDSFADYGKDFRRRVGIESEQALELFHQTISLKAVDNLNEFVRSHMLEPFNVADRIEKLVKHFDDLAAAHDAVVRARAQLVILDGLVAELDAFDAASSAVAELRGRAGAVRHYFAGERERLLRAEIEAVEGELGRIARELEAAEGELTALRAKEQQLVVQIAGAGGDRLAIVEVDITNQTTERDQRRQRLSTFNDLATEAGLDSIANHAQFRALIDHVGATGGALEERRGQLDAEYREEDRRRDAAEREAAQLNAELQSLATRRTNLPLTSLELRESLCADLRVDPDDLPFAGELIRVPDDARDWEGAAERVLRSFGLSLLVREDYYRTVAQWINDHHLGTRLVYFRVPAVAPGRRSTPRGDDAVRLVDLLEVRHDSAFSDWVTSELARRADHVCADTVEAFRVADKAVTRQGQIKDRQRHEKDDRRRIDDRRDYVLGWDNEAKTKALIAHAASVQNALNDIKKSLASIDGKLLEVGARQAALNKLSVFEWRTLDWEDAARRIADLEDEVKRIRGSSSELSALAAERDLVSGDLAQAERRHQELLRQQGDLTGRGRQLTTEADTAAALAMEAPSTEHDTALDEMVLGSGMPFGTTVELADVERRVAELLAEDIDKAGDRRDVAGRRALRFMQAFRVDFPREVVEIDDSMEASPEYRAMHDRIRSDDLPRFEQVFRTYLREHTIQDLLGLMAELEKNEEEIRRRVALINGSLRDIDFNEDRYIELMPEPTPNLQIREFRAELRACTEEVIGGEAEQYSEDRFLRVKLIIERFKGREGSSDSDRSWTRTVTDVRQWFVFTASERWRSDGSEHESYSSSAGKSGGQKEKLAYTILAASLAYQFKLDFSGAKSRSFRFVVIDEAFGRGSDESTRYALHLFTSLGLQLLIVTPMQKIHVIEPHVAALGFVDNVEGRYSRLQSIPIEERRRLISPAP